MFNRMMKKLNENLLNRGESLYYYLWGYLLFYVIWRFYCIRGRASFQFKNKKSDIGIGSDISISTSDTYVHLSTESKKETANLFDQVFQNLS